MIYINPEMAEVNSTYYMFNVILKVSFYTKISTEMFITAVFVIA